MASRGEDGGGGQKVPGNAQITLRRSKRYVLAYFYAGAHLLLESVENRLRLKLPLQRATHAAKSPPSFEFAPTSAAGETSSGATPPRGPHKRRVRQATSAVPRFPRTLSRARYFSERGREAFCIHSADAETSGEAPPHLHLGFRFSARRVDARDIPIRHSDGALGLRKAGNLLIDRVRGPSAK